MSDEKVRNDPVRLHKEANTLFDLGKHKEAMDNFVLAAELYRKSNNFFDSTSMLFKAGECAFMLKDYKTAIEHFLKSADLSFEKKFDRFGVSALEYARDCYKAIKEDKKAKETDKKIKEVKKKLEEAF
jgi:tetratricopeptide (TPR) repeat protein